MNLIASAAGTLLLAAASNAFATDLRGRVDGRNAYSPTPYPIGGTPLELYREDRGRLIRQGATFTAPDGMYYFRGVTPGRYVLQVQGGSYPLQVRDQFVQDVPPVVLKR